MKKITKNLIIFGIALFTFFSILTVPVQAKTEDGGFSINSTNYDITLNEDGSAKIVEIWELEYYSTGNTFNERYVLKHTEDLAKNKLLEDPRIYVGENICSEVENEEYQEDYTYHIKENDKSYKFNVFYQAKEDEKVQITLAYTLKDFVKFIDGEYYYIDFEHLPTQITQEIEDFNVTYRLYNNEPINLIENPKMYPFYTIYSVEDGKLMLYQDDIEESKHNISFKIDNKCFNIPEEKIISSENLPIKLNWVEIFVITLIVFFLLCIITIKLKKRSLKLHLSFRRIAITIIVFFFACFTTENFIIPSVMGAYLYWMFLSGFKDEDTLNQIAENIEELKNNPNIATDIIYKYKNIIDYKDLISFTVPKMHLIFFMEIADAHQRRILNLSENGDITFKLKDKKDSLFKVLSHIKKYCDKKKIEYKIDNKENITFSLDILKKYFESINNYRYIYQTFHPTMYNLIDDFNKKEKDKKVRKEFLDDCVMLASIIDVPNENNTSFLEIIKNPITPNSYISFIRNNLEKEPIGNNYGLVDITLYDIYKKHVEICKKKKCNINTGMPEN